MKMIPISIDHMCRFIHMHRIKVQNGGRLCVYNGGVYKLSVLFR